MSSIVNTFRELARTCLRIKGFQYYGHSQRGAGSEVYPLLVLDDPITANVVGNTLQWVCNADILGIPDSDKDEDIEAIQESALSVALSIYNRLVSNGRQLYGFTAIGLSLVSLRGYDDNNAAGYRATYTLSSANPSDRCLADWDTDKKLETPNAYPNFSTDDAEGCAEFINGTVLPNFKV